MKNDFIRDNDDEMKSINQYSKEINNKRMFILSNKKM